MVRGQAGTNPGMPMSSPGHGVVPACASAGTQQVAGRPSWKPAGQSFHTRASIGSSMPSWRVRRTILLPASSQVETRLARSQGRQPASFIAQGPLVERPQEADDDRLLAIGRLTSVPYLKAGTSDTLVSSSPADSRQGRRSDRQRHRRGPRPLPPQLRGRSPSTTGPSTPSSAPSGHTAFFCDTVPLGSGRERQWPLAAHFATMLTSLPGRDT